MKQKKGQNRGEGRTKKEGGGRGGGREGTKRRRENQSGGEREEEACKRDRIGEREERKDKSR